ncbi:hypothetical protein DCS_06135 [Drechmeria coniospora]|uniref:Defect at low temperature protein 1 n=1 Tax=Drechmeria coniospora TaxID=98403 RepID=A0A151GAS4_DRECN|nr:hypothetical protein DCS_06135 [Drechmeria coniospora]KYK54178.1 hypothetical protein DCS_06135 [Drechmeria coniospora]
MAPAYRRVFFRVAYGCAYFLLYLVLVGLLLITPGDAIERSLQNGQNYNVLIITISYVVTIVVVVFVYVVRLYINKTALAAIPKAWVPIEKGDVKDAVYAMVGAGLDRSAAIAHEARPRVETEARRPGTESRTAVDKLGVALPARDAVWGDVEHHGWASPNSTDLPNLQYAAVLSELPYLIEAKALAVAPAREPSASGPPSALGLDADRLRLLQRQPGMSLRAYVDHLAGLGVAVVGRSTVRFLGHYEHARFSDRPISNARFREIMNLFADVLRDMRPPRGPDDDVSAPSESDIDNDAPRDTNPSSPRSILSCAGSTSPRPSVGRQRRILSAPAKAFDATSAGSSSVAPSRSPDVAREPSCASLRSKFSSSDSGSVIRLATREDPEALPYVLNLRTTAGSR